MDGLRTAGEGVDSKGIVLQNWKDGSQFSGGKRVGWSKGWGGSESSLVLLTTKKWL